MICKQLQFNFIASSCLQELKSVGGLHDELPTPTTNLIIINYELGKADFWESYFRLTSALIMALTYPSWFHNFIIIIMSSYSGQTSIIIIF